MGKSGAFAKARLFYFGERGKSIQAVNDTGNANIGLIGAGRLGRAIASVWLARSGRRLAVWSRAGRLSTLDAGGRICEGEWVRNWTDTLSARSVVVAIPGAALLDLARNSDEAKAFTGTIYSAAASLSRRSLQNAFPQAVLVCVAPFLIDGTNSIPMLTLRPNKISESNWFSIRSELEMFGEIDTVEDEDVFARLSLIGSSWPTVVQAMIDSASKIGVSELSDRAAAALGRRLFFRAILSLTSDLCKVADPSATNEVATPGGITERGLRNLENISELLDRVFHTMHLRSDELRA